MSKYVMSVSAGSNAPDETHECSSVFSAYWLAKGQALVNGMEINRGAGALLQQGETIAFLGQTDSTWVRFDLTEGSGVPGALLSEPVSLPSQPENAACLLRLDQVTFPPGGVAYRHVHPGDGIRFLVNGGLRVIGDTHQQDITEGQAWFESANSPVRAEADAKATTTSFVRFMILPSVYLGKPTIQILDKTEAEQPRVQLTHRHVDKLTYLPVG